MEKETLKRIFNFLEAKENKSPIEKGTLMWKISFNEPLTEKDLNVEGDLYLEDKNIPSLPNNLKVAGDLRLTGSRITSLPNSLKVGGDLVLAWTNITSLPKGLEVGKILYIKNSPLTKYTDQELREMVKPGFIKEKIVS